MLSTGAMAREGSFYIGIDGGLMQPETSDIDLDSFDNAGDIDWDVGYDFDVVAGYDLGAFRSRPRPATRAPTTTAARPATASSRTATRRSISTR